MAPFWQFAKKMLRRRGQLAAALICALITAGGLGVGLLSLAPMFNLILDDEGKSLFDLATQYNAGSPLITIPAFAVNLLPQGRFEGIVVLVVVIVLITIFGGIANFLHLFISQSLAIRTVAQIRQEVFRHIIHLPLTTVLTRGPSEFIARVIRDAAELQRGFVALTSKAVTQLFKGLAAFCVAIYFQPALTLTATVVAPVLIIVLRKLGKRIRRGTRDSLQAQQGLLRITTETLHGLRAVKANTGERRAAGWFLKVNKEVVKQDLRVRTARALTAPAVEILAILVIGMLAIIAARLIVTDQLSFEKFFMALGSLGIAGAAFRPLAGLVTEIQAAAAPAGRLAEILDESREATATARQLPRHHISIKFEEVSYTYPEADRLALDSVSLKLTSGDRLAIVGPNGSGKTTLVSLLPRLLEPSTGRVLIDDQDIATVNLRSLRRQIGVVTQETVLFRGTIAENIGFGCEATAPDFRDQIVSAARRAHADEFIEALPNGYDTHLTELGASLSGGQRQRLAIARAILRDPAILILDEATSQIDAESEAHINAALADFCRGRTAILIAHRLSTVLNADRILVMDQGRVVAQGTHEQLLATCDLYQRLTKTQLVASV